MTVLMPTKTRVEVMERYLDAFDRQDWETLKACLTPDAMHIEPGGMELHGPEATVEGLKVFKTAFPDLKHTLTRVVAGADDMAVEMIWTATHTGPLVTPSATIPPTGKPVTLYASKVFVFEGDLIRYTRHYWDQLELLAAIGAVPKPA
jgi:predicted ester cyclase